MKTKGKLLDLSIGLDGKQRITISVDSDMREAFDDLQGDYISLEVKKWRKGRSLDANAYAWVLIDKLACALGLTKREVYRAAIREIGGVSETVCVPDRAVDRLCEGWEKKGWGWQAERCKSKLVGCTNVILYFGSSTYDSRQMSALIDQLITECKAFGIETLPPEQLAGMVDRWGKQEV